MIIIHVATGLGGGTGTVILELAKEQICNGNTVAVVTPYNRKDELTVINSGIRYIPSDTKKYFPGSFLILGVNCRKAINKLQQESNEPIIVHYHNFVSLGLLSKPFSKSVCTIHSKVITSNIDRMIYKMILRKNTRFVGVSEDTTEYFLSLQPKTSIECVCNGIANRQYKPKSIDQHSDVCICYVGALTDAKGWKYVLDAFVNLYNRGINVSLVIAGKGYHGEEIKLANDIRDTDYGKKVFVLGEINDAGINVIPNASILVLPSVSEGTPMTLLEALRAGVPVLATRVGGIPAIIHEGVNGYFIERDIHNIENAILNLINDRALYRDISQNCINVFKENYSAQKMMAAYNELYKDIIYTRGTMND